MSTENAQFDHTDPSARAGEVEAFPSDEVLKLLTENNPSADEFLGLLAGLHEGVSTSVGVADTGSLMSGVEAELEPAFEEFSKEKLNGGRFVSSAGGIRDTFDRLKSDSAFQEVELPVIDAETGHIEFDNLDQVRGYLTARQGRDIPTETVKGESYSAGGSELHLEKLQDLIDKINNTPDDNSKLRIAVGAKRSLGTYIPVHELSSINIIIDTVYAGDVVPDVVDRTAEVDAREKRISEIAEELSSDALDSAYRHTLWIETEARNLREIYKDQQQGRITDEATAHLSRGAKDAMHTHREALKGMPRQAARVQELIAERQQLRRVEQ